MRAVLIIVAALLLCVCAAKAGEWEEETSRHFILKQQGELGADPALRSAEKALDQVRQGLGLRHVARGWTWGERVTLRVYASKAAFAAATGAPAWAVARASPAGHEIATFVAGGKVPYERVAHEVTHLLLADYLDGHQLPLWMDEGVAQWSSISAPPGQWRSAAHDLVARGRYTPVSLFPRRGELSERPAGQALDLYIQWVCMVDYMVSRYGSAAFSKLVRRLRDGGSFPDALRFTYPPSADTMLALEQGFLAWAAPVPKEE